MCVCVCVCVFGPREVSHDACESRGGGGGGVLVCFCLFPIKLNNSYRWPACSSVGFQLGNNLFSEPANNPAFYLELIVCVHT